LFAATLKSPEKTMKKGFFPEEVIEEIRSRVDIVQIVGEYVRLTRSGKNFKGLCPFHQEKTPSFFVLPDKQIFHCFGCNKGGNVFKFLMEAEKFTFPEVIFNLSKRCGIPLNFQKDPETERKSRLFSVLERAAKLFAAQLYNAETGEKARNYLKMRGISHEIARRFRIGFAPDSWDFLTRNLGTNPEILDCLHKVGLVKPRNSGEGYFDVFRNRLMVPIVDLNGRIVAFGGRVIRSEDEPKYLNSPETEIFNKRKVLFNFREASTEIRRANKAILVEGYLDVISLVQAGIKNVVASLGTALSADQVNLLARNCEMLYICYDADEAGQKATIRAISMQKDTALQARIVSFPDEKDDPDSFVRREGPKKFYEILQQSRDIYDFLIESLMKGLPKPLEISSKEKILRELKNFIPNILSPVARSEVLKNVSRLLDLEPSALEKTLSSNKPLPKAKKVLPTSKELKGLLQGQEWVIKHLVEFPKKIEEVKEILSPASFPDPQLKKIFETICLKSEALGDTLKPAEIFSSLEDSELESRLSEILVALAEKPEPPFEDCVQALVKHRLEKEAEDLQKQVDTAMKNGNSEEITRLLRQQTQVRRNLESLKKKFPMIRGNS